MVSKHLEQAGMHHTSRGSILHGERWETIRTEAREITPAQWGLAAVLLLMAYVWLLSGLDKILSPDFTNGLAGSLKDSLHDNPNHWYVQFINWAVMPRTGAFAVAVEVGELLVAIGLVGGAVWWLTRRHLSDDWSLALFLGVCGALVGGAIMTLNYYFLAGFNVPWLMTDAPFNEGLSIDGLLTLIALALLAIHLLAWFRPGQSASTGRR